VNDERRTEMRRNSRWLLTAIGLVVGLLTAVPASAEMFLDLYVGASFFGDPDFSIETNNGAFRETEKGSADTNVTGGGRFGYWFSEMGLPFLGVAGDVSYFEPTFKGPTGADLVEVKVRTVPMSPLVMLRLPIMSSPDLPGGKFNIYAAAGPGFFWTEQKTTVIGIDRRISSDTIEVGVDFRAGLAWNFTPQFKIFGEYRFTHYSIGKESDRGNSVEADLDAHHALFGFGYSFR
jgi:opacity protein-like surface antigen